MGALHRSLTALRAWVVARWKPLVAVVAVIAVVTTGVGIWVVLKPTTSVDCSSLEAVTPVDAHAVASGCGAEVDVTGERTPWQRTWALPSGETRMDISSMPTQVQVDGAWVPLDPTLVVAADEPITVAAPTAPMGLNPGGEAGKGKPLASIEHDGQTLEIWFPLDLPVPEVDDSQAVYDLGAGLRLIMSINVDATGLIPVVEISTPEAAANLAQMLAASRGDSQTGATGLEVEYGLTLPEGLTLSVDEERAVRFQNASGETQFLAQPPTMWDSAGGNDQFGPEVTEVGSGDRTRSPSDGDAIAPMGVRLADQTIIVSPDLAMLESQETVWPIYLDPAITTTGPSEWVAIRTGGFTGTLHNWGDISPSTPGEGTGYCSAVSSCNTVFTQRLIWQFSGLTTISSLAGADISAASFRVNGVHSAYCTAQTTTLHRTSPISSGSSWGSVAWYEGYGSRTEYHKSSCGTPGYREFDALGGARWAADNNQTTLPLGLLVNESNMNAWKRFRHDTTLSITYNRAPNTPSSLQLTSPSVPTCTVGASRPFIATARPTLSAIGADPDGSNVQMSFEVAAVSSLSTNLWTSGNQAAIVSGARGSVVVPSGPLVDGVAYAWRARAFDGEKYSALSPWCEFEVDLTPPAMPLISSATLGATARYSEASSAGPGTESTVVLVDSFESRGPVAYTQSFSAGEDGWQVMGAGYLGNSNQQLYVYTRKGTWQSIGVSRTFFGLTPGVSYVISFREQNPAIAGLSVRVVTNGTAIVFEGSSSSVTRSATFVATSTSQQLGIQLVSPTATQLSMYIDDVLVQPSLVQGWSSDAGRAQAEQVGLGRSGSAAMRVDKTGLTTPAIMKTVDGLVPGTRYIVSGWTLPGPNTGSVTTELGIEGIGVGSLVSQNSSGWQQVEYAFVATSPTHRLTLRSSYTASDGYVAWDDIHLQSEAQVVVRTAASGGVGQVGMFAISRGADTRVAYFKYGFNNPSMPSTATPGTNGVATISFTPTVTGPVTLYVRSYDLAGNFSAIREYTFVVATPAEDGVWTFDEGDGASTADQVGSPALDMRLDGDFEWVDGPHALFGSRDDDSAVAFGGTDSLGWTDAPILDTRDSFAISTFVRLDEGDVGEGSYPVLAQQGVSLPGFQVGYEESCPGMTDGCWTFSMPDSATGTGWTTVQSAVPVTGGEWVHLTAEFDETEQAMRLWVCEVGTPSDPAIGEPIRSDGTRTATPWTASGAFTVGMGVDDGLQAFWPGQVDNIRVFTGEVVSEAKIRRLCQGAEATDFNQGETALDPTTVEGG